MPKDIKSAQRFLGMVNYYRTFIPECSKVANPLIDFISKKMLWGPKIEHAVMQLKSSLVTVPVLVPFVVGGEYRLTTDASLIAMGAVLERMKDGRVHGVVRYFSKIVSPTQARYHVGEIELLAIIAALHHFRYYLHGHHFTQRTDHISLLSLKNLKEPSKRLANWLSTLSEYDFDIEYIKGPQNFVADALSRPCTTPTEKIFPIVQLSQVDPRQWKNQWDTDPWTATVQKTLGLTNQCQANSGDKSLFEKILQKV